MAPHPKPFVIFLNGPSSSGKTSIAKALGYLLPSPTLVIGIDTFIKLIPAGKPLFLFDVEHDQNNSPIARVIPTHYGKKLCHALTQTTKVLIDNGFNLIIDEVLLEKDALNSYLEQLATNRVYLVGVRCQLATLEEREAVRGDRKHGMARAQLESFNLLNLRYDFEVDTTHTVPFDCARQILAFIEKRPKPSAFERCREKFAGK